MSTEPVPFVSAIPVTRTSSTPLIDTVARVLSVLVLVALILARFRPLEGAALQAMSLSIAAASAVQISQRPGRIEMALTVLAASAVALFYISLGWAGTRLAPTSIILAASLGVGTILVLGTKAAWSTAHLKTFLLASFCPVMVVFTSVSLAVAAGWQPLVYDNYLYRFDASLGFQPSFVLGRAFLRWHPLWVLALWVYGSLPLAIVLSFIVLARRRGGRLGPAVTAVALTAVIGFALYQVCPAMGPLYGFSRDFPIRVPANVPVAIFGANLDIPRNAMPSLHVAWAFVLFWNLRRERIWLRFAAFAYFLITVMATMGFGEHYFVDVVVGVPLALAVQGCATRDWRTAAGAFALVGGWLAYCRFGLPLLPPAAPWGWVAVSGSLALCVMAALILDRHQVRGWRRLETGEPAVA